MPTVPVAMLAPLIVVIVPIVLMFVKKAIPPSASVTILGLAPILGAVADYVIAWTTGKAADPATGALYGALGVFVREVVDQIRKAPWTPESWTPNEGGK